MAQPPALPSIYDYSEPQDGQLIITFKPQRNPSLRALGESFAALDRFYSRMGPQGAELVLQRIESGSIVATVAAMSPLLGEAMPVLSQINNAVTFGKRLTKAIKAFAEMETPAALPSGTSFDDAKDLEQILKPVIKNGGGRLGLRSLTYETSNPENSRYLNVEFQESEVQRAYDSSARFAPLALDIPLLERPAVTQRLVTEEALVLDQTTRKPAKESGRTGDKGVIASVSDKSLPVYFKKSAQSLKERMVLGEDNPLRFLFIVDAYVHLVNGDPNAYTVIHLHSAMPLEE
jgi:hypothetical protein